MTLTYSHVPLLDASDSRHTVTKMAEILLLPTDFNYIRDRTKLVNWVASCRNIETSSLASNSSFIPFLALLIDSGIKVVNLCWTLSLDQTQLLTFRWFGSFHITHRGRSMKMWHFELYCSGDISPVRAIHFSFPRFPFPAYRAIESWRMYCFKTSPLGSSLHGSGQEEVQCPWPTPK